MSVYKHNNFSYIGNKFTGSQCLGTGMTPFAVQFTFKNGIRSAEWQNQVDKVI
ncbi:hypothetical protein [Wolbachia endosymbiont of Aedes albopictus]|uniref:hypothetical protein n=1 Tax=Wolbachia endosymbiont of Aedes albopictus TaxID=167957 RepID=UPI002166EE8D|nr:hypothetical protein [Wolbachia endosymbiont of Aedes albopictus]UVW83683.1 hypothetical protein NHG98_04935 [Wolbachia endosymbiont of Aedes albopictus]